MNMASELPHRKPVSEAESSRVSNLKIAILSDALKDRNGVDTYYRDLAVHLASSVKEIRYFSPNPEDGNFSSRFNLPLPGDSTQKLVVPDIATLFAALQSFDPDVIISATSGPFGLYGLRAAGKLKAGFIVGFHTLIEDLCSMYWQGLSGMVLKRYMEIQNKLLFKGAQFIAVNSASMIESAKNLTQTPVILVGTPVHELFVNKPVIQQPETLTRILFAGRLAPEKNLDAIFSAAQQLPHLNFSIAGNGPMREEVEAKAQQLSNLTYLGPLKREEVVNAIDQHDLLVLPSHLEAFGTIALEAMMRERLVLLSLNCGILSWSGLAEGVYTIQQEEDLAQAIERLFQLTPAQRQERAKLARKGALAIHRDAIDDWRSVLAQIGKKGS